LVEPGRNTPDLWVSDLARRANTRLTFDPGTEASAVWSADGTRIIFRSDRAGNNDLYLKGTGGTGAEVQALVDKTAAKVSSDWSADGRYVVYHAARQTTGLDIWILPMSGDRTPREFLQTPFNEMQGRLLPDGHWMAYTSDESGSLEVHVRPFPAGAEHWVVSTNGGSEPTWRGDGKELFYLGADRMLMSISIAGGPRLEADVPKPLFETNVGAINPDFRRQYAASRDGNRFLVNTMSKDASSPPIIVVLNWTTALNK
jgi:eukaryotic-like serine/threonine-protein kinase